jgi:hypothetical protein
VYTLEKVLRLKKDGAMPFLDEVMKVYPAAVHIS